jgi:hypothetical protein
MIPLWLAAAASGATWALEERLVSEVRPPFGRWQTTESTLHWLVEWDGGPEMRATLCAVRQAEVMGATSTFPEDFQPTYVRPVRFDGRSLAMGPVVEVVGEGDEDRDGHPGLSVTVSHPRVGSGQVFVRQESRMGWSGELGPDGRITGRVAYEPAQTQLGATTFWLKIGVPQRPAAGSTFVLTPLEDGAGCDRVRETGRAE